MYNTLLYTEHPLLGITAALALTYISLENYCSNREKEKVNTMGYTVATIEQSHWKNRANVAI